MIGSLRGRAQPHRIVNPGGNRQCRLGAVEAAGRTEFSGHPDFNHFEIADVAIADPFAGEAGFQAGAPPRAALQHPLMSLHGAADGAPVCNARGQRFFRVEVLACRGGGRGDHGVPVVRRRIHHGIDVLAGEDFAEVTVNISILQFSEIAGSFSMLRIHITHRYHLHAFVIEE